MINTTTVKTPVGNLGISVEDGFVVKIFQTDEIRTDEKTDIHIKVENQINEYFNGKRKEFEIPLLLSGTDFQKKVWQTLQKIPFGKTLSYSEIAKIIGSEKAVRAVGSAIGKNPIPIIIPCHRVIRTDGNLGGFAWGLDCKTKLLELEK